MTVKTVFKIAGQQYTVNQVGEEAVNSIRKEFRRVKIVLLGFIINDVFIKSVI